MVPLGANKLVRVAAEVVYAISESRALQDSQVRRGPRGGFSEVIVPRMLRRYPAWVLDTLLEARAPELHRA